MISRKKFCYSPKRLIFELLKRLNILCIPSVKVWKYRKLYPVLDEQETYNKVYIQQSVPCLSTSVYWTLHQTIVKNSLSKITRPRMIEHTDVHFRTHRNVAKRSWHFLPLRFVPIYINYAMFYERVYVVAGRSSLSLFQAQCRWWRPEGERHAKSWRGGKNEKLKGYRACNHLFLYWLITYCIFCVKTRILLLNKPFAPR